MIRKGGMDLEIVHLTFTPNVYPSRITKLCVENKVW